MIDTKAPKTFRFYDKEGRALVIYIYPKFIEVEAVSLWSESVVVAVRGKERDRLLKFLREA